jgi:hypothetical protein
MKQERIVSVLILELVLAVIFLFVALHLLGQRDRVILDQRMYIENGCQGHYQGAGS